MRFEHVIRDDSGSVLYAVLSDGTTREVTVHRWASWEDHGALIARVVYPEGATSEEARAARETVIAHARRMAQRLRDGEGFDPQLHLGRLTDAVDPTAAMRARDPISPTRRRAEAAQDDAIRRRR